MTLTKTSKALFDVAKAMSEMSDFPKWHIGCCAYYKHKVIATGCNVKKTHPVQKELNGYRFQGDTQHYAHAEVECLLSLMGRKNIDFSRVCIYLYREHKDGSLALSKPCSGCMAMIRNLGIRQLYYTGERSYVHEELVY